MGSGCFTDTTIKRASTVLLVVFQLKDLLGRSIEAWVDLFDERNPEHLPSLKMELVYDDEKMQFYPPYDELVELVLGIVDIISKSLQQVC